MKSFFKRSSTEIWRINLVSVPKNPLARRSVLCDSPSLCNMWHNISSKARSFPENSSPLVLCQSWGLFFKSVIKNKCCTLSSILYLFYLLRKFTIRDTREKRLEQWRLICGPLASWTKTKKNNTGSIKSWKQDRTTRVSPVKSARLLRGVFQNVRDPVWYTPLALMESCT